MQLIDSQFHSGTRTRRGVSLIEVLVVLVILVVGILTIIRLFPSGFFSIQSTGNAGQADTLGTGALGTISQDSQSFPEAILPGTLDTYGNPSSSATDAAYDVDDPNLLDNARVIFNETITIPTASGGKPVYAVKYGPFALGVDPAVGTDTATSTILTMLAPSLSVNGMDWTPRTGDSVGNTTAPPDPQDTLANSPTRTLLVDYTNKRIALPLAPYTLTNTTTTPPAYESYDQRVVIKIYGDNSQVYTQYLNVPAATKRDSANPFAPETNTNPQGYLPDTLTNYQGGWFDPTGTVSTETYPDPNVALPNQAVPPTVNWMRVVLYRPFTGIANTKPFGRDPYQFQIINPNINGAAVGANVGAIAFNPLAAQGYGTQALKAKISYLTSSWKILREDHDIPALTGAGSTFVARTTVPNLKLAGSANPDNSINPGIADSNYSLVILDLDSGKVIAPGGTADPTNPDSPINNEDLNGTKTDPALVNISYSTGRLTFGSNAFGDNSAANGSGTAKAHRIRIFYTADLDWTVAVQKPAAYFNKVSTLGTPPETTPLAANEFAYDPSVPCVYVARCNAGKTFEVDGTATPSGGGTARTFSQTTAAGLVLVSLGAPDVQIPLPATVTGGSTINFSAVRGLSARSVVAWKERNRYKVHSVDTLLNRTP